MTDIMMIFLKVYLLEWKVLFKFHGQFFIDILLNFVSEGLIYKMSALIQVVASHWTATKPLPEPVIT